MPERIFAVLYVSVMGLTRSYRKTVFTFIFEVFLLNLFYRCILLYKPIYGVAKTNGSHTGINTTCGFNLVIVVINTLFADAK